MPIHPKLFEILVCPVTKQPLSNLEENKVKELNDLIACGEIKLNSGEIIEEPIEEALVTRNGQTIYLVKDGIPIMLEDQSIPTVQISEW